jgi:hypothetical protein
MRLQGWLWCVCAWALTGCLGSGDDAGEGANDCRAAANACADGFSCQADPAGNWECRPEAGPDSDAGAGPGGGGAGGGGNGGDEPVGGSGAGGDEPVGGSGAGGDEPVGGNGAVGSGSGGDEPVGGNGAGGNGAGGDEPVGGNGAGGNGAGGNGAGGNGAGGDGEPFAAAACETDDDCAEGTCTPDNGRDGRVPGGFCDVGCFGDRECGPNGTCLAGGEAGRTCYLSCDGPEDCREGWDCRGLDGAPDVTVCLPDCREAGCGRGTTCNEALGRCEISCVYPCGADETCEEGRCIRDDGTCDTDYHCTELQLCHEGECIPGEARPCINEQCGAEQTCAEDGSGNRACLWACEDSDEPCPIDRMCYPGLGGPDGGGACWIGSCASVYDACTYGSLGQLSGTCYPLTIGTPGSAPTGFCRDAGTLERGGACDAQATARDEAGRAALCEPGTTCFDDPDDPFEPGRDTDATGTCVGLCEPGEGQRCQAGEACIDFSSDDDEATPGTDESRPLGLCLGTDCRVIANDCDGGEICTPYSLIDPRGECRPAGDTPLGARCRTSQECGAQAFCANDGDGRRCLGVCERDGDEAGCPDNETCVRQPGWDWGVCLR